MNVAPANDAKAKNAAASNRWAAAWNTGSFVGDGGTFLNF
jgi:hypothetical protein